MQSTQPCWLSRKDSRGKYLGPILRWQLWVMTWNSEYLHPQRFLITLRKLNRICSINNLVPARQCTQEHKTLSTSSCASLRSCIEDVTWASKEQKMMTCHVYLLFLLLWHPLLGLLWGSTSRWVSQSSVHPFLTMQYVPSHELWPRSFTRSSVPAEDIV